MSEMTERVATRAWWAWAPGAAIAANVFAICTVMFWIYYARAMFIARHPDLVAVEPPTISRAISDPLIGVPFHFWVSVSGILLVFGVFWVAVFNWRLYDHAPRATANLARALRVGMPLAVLFQVSSGIGMYVLSGYRFPDHHAEHMVGSYTFFIAQAVVVVIGTAVSSAILRDKASLALLQDAGLVRPGILRARKWSGVFCILLTIYYVFLFQAKSMDFGAMNGAVYVAYTSTEPLLITCFLLFLALFQTDLVALRRLQRRS